MTEGYRQMQYDEGEWSRTLVPDEPQPTLLISIRFEPEQPIGPTHECLCRPDLRMFHIRDEGDEYVTRCLHCVGVIDRDPIPARTLETIRRLRAIAGDTLVVERCHSPACPGRPGGSALRPMHAPVEGAELRGEHMECLQDRLRDAFHRGPFGTTL